MMEGRKKPEQQQRDGKSPSGPSDKMPKDTPPLAAASSDSAGAKTRAASDEATTAKQKLDDALKLIQIVDTIFTEAYLESKKDSWQAWSNVFTQPVKSTFAPSGNPEEKKAICKILSARCTSITSLDAPSSSGNIYEGSGLRQYMFLLEGIARQDPLAMQSIDRRIPVRENFLEYYTKSLGISIKGTQELSANCMARLACLRRILGKTKLIKDFEVLSEQYFTHLMKAGQENEENSLRSIPVTTAIAQWKTKLWHAAALGNPRALFQLQSYGMFEDMNKDLTNMPTANPNWPRWYQRDFDIAYYNEHICPHLRSKPSFDEFLDREIRERLQPKKVVTDSFGAIVAERLSDIAAEFPSEPPAVSEGSPTTLRRP